MSVAFEAFFIAYFLVSATSGFIFVWSSIANHEVKTNVLTCILLGYFWPVWLAVFIFVLLQERRRIRQEVEFAAAMQARLDALGAKGEEANIARELALLAAAQPRDRMN